MNLPNWELYFFSPTFWLILGGILVFLEFFMPGAIFLFIGIGALVVGGIVFYFPISIPTQIILLLVFSTVSILTLGRLVRRFFRPEVSASPVESEYKDKIADVVEDILVKEKGGRIRLFGTEWDAISLNKRVSKGTKVRILSRENLTFVVEEITIKF